MNRTPHPLPLTRRALCVALAGCAWPAGSWAQAAATTAPALKVTLADGKSRSFGLAELQALPAETATARLRDGSPFSVTGVSVTALLKLAGLDLSATLGGRQIAGAALVAHAADGYKAVFGLAVADPHFGHPPLLVSWLRADGSPLAPEAGPLQLVNTGESRPVRWVRQLVALEVRPL